MVGDLAESQQRLTAYTQALEKSNKELDDFTYIVSHDLKEPLRSIDAFSKFAVEGSGNQLDAEGRMYLERVRANAKRMQELIEDLLEVSRLSRRPNELQQVDSTQLIEDITLRFEHLMQEKHVQLVVDPALPTLTADPVRLGEVFANLISNAIKYNDKPVPTIEIGGKAVDGWYEFCVRDNGPGIAPEYHEKIFEIFQRLGKKEEHEGTGVGLTIVKKIVELHKGRVWVDSALGQGTTFYFTIPTDETVLRGKQKLGEILVAKGLVTKQAVQEALKEQAGGAHGGARGTHQDPTRGG
jgi:light-regulated signal transduction histidine kinase (bacteriophytochrome)